MEKRVTKRSPMDGLLVGVLIILGVARSRAARPEWHARDQ
jgi:hypothetical protein